MLFARARLTRLADTALERPAVAPARFAVGDAVIGFVDTRSSQAEFAVAEAKNLTSKPLEVSWETAGGLPIAGTTAYAAGGVGSLAVQLAQHTGARVIGLASEANHE